MNTIDNTVYLIVLCTDNVPTVVHCLDKTDMLASFNLFVNHREMTKHDDMVSASNIYGETATMVELKETI